MFLAILFFLMAFPTVAGDLSLEGAPLQLEWADVNGDGHQDLIALMLMTETEGQITTYFENETLHGVYEDETIREKYLVVRLHDKGRWQEAGRIDLGRSSVLGFAVEDGALMLWKNDALTRYAWEDNRWDPKKRITTPGILSRGGVSMKEFPFWLRVGGEGYWLVPDLEGLHVIRTARSGEPLFITYPDLAMSSERDDGAHVLTMAVPRLLPLDSEPGEELVFQGPELASGWRLGETEAAYTAAVEGTLIDLNGDGMADLVRAEQEGEVARLRDLSRMQTRVQTFLARAPLTFPRIPDREQVVSGLVLAESESDIELAAPFLDINGDGRADLVGIALRLTMMKLVQGAATGRIRIKFFMHLAIQDENGRFEEINGSPFEMFWKLNIRRLELPALAQLTADFNGDGWVDILVEKNKRYEITLLTEQGIESERLLSGKFPKVVHDPDLVYGRDLNGDRRAELIALKLTPRRSIVSVIEVRR